MAKNALLTVADLWRGLGESLDPELTMVCPIITKKFADKVEFLAEAAREVRLRLHYNAACCIHLSNERAGYALIRSRV